MLSGISLCLLAAFTECSQTGHSWNAAERETKLWTGYLSGMRTPACGTVEARDPLIREAVMFARAQLAERSLAAHGEFWALTEHRIQTKSLNEASGGQRLVQIRLSDCADVCRLDGGAAGEMVEWRGRIWLLGESRKRALAGKGFSSSVLWSQWRPWVVALDIRREQGAWLLEQPDNVQSEQYGKSPLRDLSRPDVTDIAELAPKTPQVTARSIADRTGLTPAREYRPLLPEEPEVRALIEDPGLDSPPAAKPESVPNNAE
jgi:hypothetical protein